VQAEELINAAGVNRDKNAISQRMAGRLKTTDAPHYVDGATKLKDEQEIH
jgi:hypothetical protein